MSERSEAFEFPIPSQGIMPKAVNKGVLPRTVQKFAKLAQQAAPSKLPPSRYEKKKAAIQTTPSVPQLPAIQSKPSESFVSSREPSTLLVRDLTGSTALTSQFSAVSSIVQPSKVMESIGLAAAKEAQATINAQKIQLKDLEDEVARLRRELEFNADEMARRRRIIEELEGSMAKKRETAIPLDEARILAEQILRKGYAIRTFTLMIESASILQHNLRAALHIWAGYIFGPDVRFVLLKKRQEERLTAFDEYVTPEVPSRLKESLALLRAEQLFLMDEISKTFREVSTLNTALQASPDEATQVLTAFDELEKRRLKAQKQPSINNIIPPQQLYDTSKAPFSQFQTLNGAALVHSLIFIEKLIKYRNRREMMNAFKTIQQLEGKADTIPRRIAHRRPFVFAIRTLFRSCLQHAFRALRLYRPKTSLLRSRDIAIKAIPGSVLESMGFALQPSYFTTLPSIASWRYKNV